MGDTDRSRRRVRNAAIVASVVAAAGIAVLVSGSDLVLAILPAIALACGVAGVWIWERGDRKP